MDIWWTILILCFLALVAEKYLRRLKIDKFDQRYVLITGCDTGFGNALAKRLDSLNFHVFAACLTNEAVKRLTEETSSNLIAVELDVTQDASINRMIEKVKHLLPRDKGLWAVVNNAGISKLAGPSTWQTRQDYESILSVNFFGMAMVTNACFPLILKERGRVVNTSSMMGRIAFGSATYTVSKYAVEALSDVLRRENYRTGVKVSIIEPGAFKTPILNADAQFKNLEKKVGSLPDEIKRALRDDFIDTSMKAYLKGISMSSSNTEAVVDAYIHAVTAKYPQKRMMQFSYGIGENMHELHVLNSIHLQDAKTKLKVFLLIDSYI